MGPFGARRRGFRRPGLKNLKKISQKWRFLRFVTAIKTVRRKWSTRRLRGFGGLMGP